MKAKWTFRRSIVIALLFLTMIAFAAIILFYARSREDNRRTKIQSMQKTSEHIDDMLTISLNGIKELENLLYIDPRARNILLEGSSQYDEYTRFENQNYVDTSLKHIVSGNSVILRAAIVTEYDDVYCTDNSVPEDYVEYIKDTAEKHLKKDKGLYGEDYYIREYTGKLRLSNYRMITIIHPLYAYGAKPIGYLGVDLDYSALESILRNSLSDPVGDYLITFHGLELLCIGNTDFKEGVKERLITASGDFLRKGTDIGRLVIDRQKYYIHVKENLTLGWVVTQVYSEPEIFSGVNREMFYVICWVALLMLGALMVTLWYAKRITEPLEQFCKEIQKTGTGHIRQIALGAKNRSYEVDRLVSIYNLMAERVNEYIGKEIVYIKNQKQIQSMMLRYQINPHFLYNTLNILASMGELADIPEIVEITQSLSSIIKYNLKGGQLVTLGTEINMVQAYIQIQKIRFPNKFQVHYEIDDSIMDLKIVKFILQPIVENVFKHGFRNSEGNNIVRIVVRRENERLIIAVWDNGCGLPAEKLEELNDVLQNETSSTSVIEEKSYENGIGIHNVNIRLKNYYGNDYGVVVKSRESEGTEVVLYLRAEDE